LSVCLRRWCIVTKRMNQDEIWHRGTIGLGPGHIVLDGDPSNTAPPPIFGPCLLWPNGWMDQDATWYGGRPLA